MGIGLSCSSLLVRAAPQRKALKWPAIGSPSRYPDAVLHRMLTVCPTSVDRLDETCFFLAVDFDQSGWLEDATAFAEPCHRMDLSAALERSRSGRGGHVWLFFEEALPAALARKLGSYVVTETMERRPDIGFDSYDRFFPNQDTLPHGGFGNLIALPLQKHRRGDGNSVFVDDSGVPHQDQWAFLSTIRRISRGHVEGVVREAERRGRILGVSLPPAEDD